jgi:hypothetical protein
LDALAQIGKRQSPAPAKLLRHLGLQPPLDQVARVRLFDRRLLQIAQQAQTPFTQARIALAASPLSLVHQAEAFFVQSNQLIMGPVTPTLSIRPRIQVWLLGLWCLDVPKLDPDEPPTGVSAPPSQSLDTINQCRVQRGCFATPAGG